MTVNFSLLPPKWPVLDKLPPRFIWAVICSAITITGDFLVLLVWPKVEPSALVLLAELDTSARSLPLLGGKPARLFEIRRDLGALKPASNRKDADKPVLARRIGELQAELIRLDPARALTIA
jgi:hypothetical protein